MIVYPIMILAIESDQERLFMQELYEAHYRLMYAKAYEILGAHHDVEDIIQDAIVALINKVALIRTLERYALRAYIANTVKNFSLNHLRSQKRRNNHAFMDDGTILNGISLEQPEADIEMIRREEIERIKTGIQRLSVTDQRVLEMKYVQEMTNQEIASELGIGVDSVRPHLKRVRNRAYTALMEVMQDE